MPTDTPNSLPRHRLRELAAIAFADPADVLTDGPNGCPILRPWEDIPPAARLAVQSVTVRRRRVVEADGTEFEEEVLEIAFDDKLAALEELARRTSGSVAGPPPVAGE